MDLLAQRITESINDLALQIDHLHKLSPSDRQSFLNKIQSFKTALLAMKSNLKINNKELVENQFKSVRTEIIQMKRFLDVKLEDLKFKNANQQNKAIHQNRLNSNKAGGIRTGSISKVNQNLFDVSLISNKSQAQCLNQGKLNGSRVGVMKHISKKDYEEMMKNIVEKTQAHEQITEELATFRQENIQLKDINEGLKTKAEHYEKQKESLQIKYNKLSSEFESIQRRLRQKERECAQLKENEVQNRTRLSRGALEISHLRNQLDTVNGKLLGYSNFEQVCEYKVKLLHADLDKLQREVVVVTQEHEATRMQLQRRTKQLQSLKQNLSESIRKISKLQTQLQNQRQDLQVLESQLSKSQKMYYEMKIEKEAVQGKLQLEHKEYQEKEGQKNKQMEMLKDMLIDSEQYNATKDMEILNLKEKLSEWEQIYLELRQQRSNLQLTSTKRQSQFDKQRQAYICDLQLKKIQISRLSDQVKKSLQLTKTLQQQINHTHLNRTRIRDDNKLLSNDLKDFEIKNIQLTKNYQELKQLYLEAIDRLSVKDTQVETMKRNIVGLEAELKEAKIRLHKAKIQAINDIRNTLF